MDNKNDWINDTRYHREYSAAVKQGTLAVDTARATRDNALKAAEQLINELRREREKAAQDAYNAAVNSAQDKMTTRMDKLADDLVQALADAYAKAPGAEQTNYVTLFKLRERVSSADVAAAFDAVKGNALAILALRDVLRGKTCVDTGLPAVAPFEVFALGDAERIARSFTGAAAANLSTYAHGVYSYMSTDGSNGWVYAPKWTALCYFMEQLGA